MRDVLEIAHLSFAFAFKECIGSYKYGKIDIIEVRVKILINKIWKE